MSEPIIVGGRYQLGELLGRGGMAEVRKGVDLRLGREVAVKRLRTDLASDATFQARFRREAQSSASLNHPSIVAVYDTGEEMAHDGSDVAQPYIVMEYVAGRTLRDIVREGRKILPERALEITSGVLSALDYSHRTGIIHRDIKPGNVMLTPSGDVKVMDFGIARAVSDASSSMTQTAAVVGTAQYLSPEQARGETVDSRSDVYSAGCLLYELLTGRPPFMGDSPVAVAYQHVREQAPPPSDHDTELPPEVDAIVMKALTKRVEDRYQSAAQMRADIERYLGGRPVQAPAVAAGAAAMAAATAVVPTAAEATSVVPMAELPEDEEDEGRGNGRWWLVAILVLLGILAALAAWLLPQLLSDPPPERVAVPELVNLKQADAEQAIEDAGLVVGTIDLQPDEEVRKGRVISQNPDADSRIDVGSTVDLVVSEGKPQVTVPSVIGERRNAARQILEDAGLEVVLEVRESDEAPNTVVETDPTAGTSVAVGSTVTVYYSAGPVTVENVVGKQEAVARQILENQGFTVKVFYDDSPTDQATGSVLEQTPQAGSTQPQGTQIVLLVTDYVKPTPTPTPTDADRHATGGPVADTDALGPLRPRSVGQVGPVALDRRVGHRRDAGVAGHGGGGVGLEVPPHRDVGEQGLLAVDLQVAVLLDRAQESHLVTDGGDLVGLGVGLPVELHRVALALDAGGGDQPLSLDRDRARAASPHRVDDRLDVLLVHHQQVEVAGAVVDDVLRRVGQGDGDARAGDGVEPGRRPQPLGLALQPGDPFVVDRVGQALDLGVERGDLVLEPGQLVALGRDQGRQVGVAARTQVVAVAVDGAQHEQDPAQPEGQQRGRTPAVPVGRPGGLRGHLLRPAVPGSRPLGGCVLRGGLLRRGSEVGSRGHGD